MAIKQDFCETAKSILTQRKIRKINSKSSEYIHSAVLIPIFKENGEFKVLSPKGQAWWNIIKDKSLSLAV